MRKSNSYVHVSFDVVKEFIPRIPESRLEKEDSITPRICVAKYVRQALLAMPEAGETISAMIEIGIPVIIHAYYLQSDFVVGTEDLLEAVPDAGYTKELWIVRKPEKVWRVDYELNHISLRRIKDIYGRDRILLESYGMKKVPYQDNWENFRCLMQIRKSKQLEELIEITPFSTMMTNLLLELKKHIQKIGGNIK